MLRAWFRNWLGPTLLLTSTAKAMTEPTPTKAAAVHPPRSARRDLVAVIGCTGTGKSKLAVELAQHVQQTTLLAAATTTITGSVYADAEVISADSMQVYRGMDVISNKATAEEMGGVSHHLMSFLPAGTEYTIKDFISQARGLIGRMHQAERPVLPVVAGGTSYYVQHLLFPGHLFSDSRDDAPKDNVQALSDEAKQWASGLPEDLQASWSNFIKAAGLSSSDTEAADNQQRQSRNISAELWTLLQAVDPAMAARWHPNDDRKILRSLTVFATTGRRHSDWLQAQEAERQLQEVSEDQREVANMRRLIFWVWCEPEVLKARLDQRIHKMIERGLLDEIRELRSIARALTSKTEGRIDYTRGIFQTIGFKEFDAFLNATDAVSPVNPSQSTQNGELSGETKRLFDSAVEEMQKATRQYARRQTSWIRNQLLAEIRRAREDARVRSGGRGSPEVEIFLLDATDLAQWTDRVSTPAQDILEHFLAGKPLPDPLQLSDVAAAHLHTVYSDSSSSGSITPTDPSSMLAEKAFVACLICSPADPSQPAFLVRASEMRQHQASRRHRMAVKKANKREYEAGKKAEAAERRAVREARGGDTPEAFDHSDDDIGHASAASAADAERSHVDSRQ
ncbi:hypothetical protein V8E36_005922 [Tilletia maclaganii]